MKKSIKRTITAAAIAVIAVLVGGCGDNGVGTQTDPRAENFLQRFVDSSPLVLKYGEAWLNRDLNDEAFVFLATGECYWLKRTEDGNQWTVVERGTWHAEGTATGIAVLEHGTFSYSINNNVLTLEDDTWGDIIHAIVANDIYFNP